MKAFKTLGFATDKRICTEEIHIIRSWKISNGIKETPDNVTNTAISRETRTIFAKNILYLNDYLVIGN